MTLEQFYATYPQQTKKINGKDFVYRYYKNENAKATLVLLTGGIGLSDLFYLHFQKFSKNFSVLTFDYQIQFDNNKEFADAVSELLKVLNEKVWLVGQSLGGIVGQIIAKEHPEVVEGLVLSNTCSLEKNMSKEAYDHLMNMIENQQKSKKMFKILPFGLYKKLIAKAVMKKTSSLNEEEKALMKGLCNAMLKLLTREYELHMIDFLIDAKNHFGMTKEDFTVFKDKVLLILSEDDHTFNQHCKDSLIHIMPEPMVVTNLTGGHLALLVRLDSYAELVSDFIKNRS